MGLSMSVVYICSHHSDYPNHQTPCPKPQRHCFLQHFIVFCIRTISVILKFLFHRVLPLSLYPLRYYCLIQTNCSPQLQHLIAFLSDVRDLLCPTCHGNAPSFIFSTTTISTSYSRPQFSIIFTTSHQCNYTTRLAPSTHVLSPIEICYLYVIVFRSPQTPPRPRPIA